MFSDCSFWRDFFANLFSDLLASVALGTLLAWWVGKRLSAYERGQERKDEKRAELEKTIRYLELLKKEIGELPKTLPIAIDRLENEGKEGHAWIPTPLWEILKPSGELPRLPIDPDLIESLATFYARLMHAARAQDWVIESWLIENPNDVPGLSRKQEAFHGSALVDFEGAHALLEGGLLDRLDLEIHALKKQLQLYEQRD